MANRLPVIIRIACVLGGIAVLYALFVLALVAAGRKTDVRALAGFVPDCVDGKEGSTVRVRQRAL